MNNTNSISVYDELDYYYKIFYPKLKLYDRWNELWVQLYLAEKSLKSKAPLVLTIIIAVVAPLTVAMSASSAVLMLLVFMNGANAQSEDYTGLLYGVFTAAFILTIAIPITVYLLRNKSIKNKISKIETEMSGIRSQLINYYNSVNPPSLPFAYSSPYVIQKLYKIIKSNRANNIHGAIYLYEKDAGNQLEEVRLRRDVKRQQLMAIAATAAAVHYMSKPDVVHVYSE